MARDVCRCASVKKSTRILTPFAARTSFTLGGQQSRRRGWKNVLRSVGNPVVFRRSSSLSPQQSVNKNHIHIFSVSIVGGGRDVERSITFCSLIPVEIAFCSPSCDVIAPPAVLLQLRLDWPPFLPLQSPQFSVLLPQNLHSWFYGFCC